MDSELVQTFAANLLGAMGTSHDVAQQVAFSLVHADLSGYATHGVGLLPLYKEMIGAGELDPAAMPELERVDGAVTKVNGRKAFGQLTGALALEAGLGAARAHGVALVGICNGGHLGRMGEWAERATGSGMVFLSFCNSGGGALNVAPFGGHARKLSTNPVAFGLPCFAAGSPDIIVDFATSQVSGSEIRKCFHENTPLHPEWTTTTDGMPLTDAKQFLEGRGALLPLGGTETGHKGYGLAIVAEVLGGIAGGLMANESDTDWFSNAAMFVLFDPLRFTAGNELGQRISKLADYLASDGARLPGKGAKMREQALREGLCLPGYVCSALKQLATELKVDIPAELADIAGAPVGVRSSRTW